MTEKYHLYTHRLNWYYIIYKGNSVFWHSAPFDPVDLKTLYFNIQEYNFICSLQPKYKLEKISEEDALRFIQEWKIEHL